MERSGAIFDQVIGRLRTSLPDLAEQVEDEGRRGRPMAVEDLSVPERLEVSARIREISGPGGRISREDIVNVEYSDDERLSILVDALRRLGSSMASTRETLAELLELHAITGPIRFRSEDVPEAEAVMDVVNEASEARARFQEVAEPLRRVLEDIR